LFQFQLFQYSSGKESKGKDKSKSKGKSKMSIQIICQNGAVEFPDKFHLYSGLIQKMATQQMGDRAEDDGSGSEDEEEEVSMEETIKVNATTECVNLMFTLLEMEHTKGNIHPPETPKKVTAPKFKIEETIGTEEVGFFKEAGKGAVFAITQVADFLSIKLITHLCFTWIAHSLNTRNTKEKMEWLGLEGETPTFEEIMEVDLKTGAIPSMDKTKTNEGGATKLPPAHIESKEGGATK
jgi:hypothetical protein